MMCELASVPRFEELFKRGSYLVKHGVSVKIVLFSHPNKHHDTVKWRLYSAHCKSTIFVVGSSYVLFSSQAMQALNAAPYVEVA